MRIPAIGLKPLLEGQLGLGGGLGGAAGAGRAWPCGPKDKVQAAGGEEDPGEGPRCSPGVPEGHQGFHVGSLEGLQGPREELEGWLSEGPDPRSHPGVAPPLTASPRILRHHQISHGQVIQPQKWNILACS